MQKKIYFKNKLSEASLVADAANGNHQAFSELYRRYKNYIHSYCYRLVSNKNEVEDIVQQIFLECWRSLKTFKNHSSFSTWLIRITINTCSGYYRISKKTFSFSADVEDEYFTLYNLKAQKKQTPLTDFIAKRKRNLIDEILLTISPKKRAVFALSYLEGMKAGEISSALKIPSATVRTRLFHARKEFISSVKAIKKYEELSLD